MRPIDKFILHIVHNWKNELNEAYSEKAIKDFINKFSEEADDLNINISEDELRKYIERFDVLKNSPKITEKDLNKWNISQLIKLVTSSKGIEPPPEGEYDITPDVVYDENGLIIYNGSNENNCLRFGRGEKWCIAKTSFNTYRYDKARKYPTFYLVRDTNKITTPGDTRSDKYRKSFFVVVVGSDNTYKVSDRTNNDVGGVGTEWQRWEPWSFVEQNFPSLRGLQRIFKYIPLSSSEKLNQDYKKNATTIREWTKLPFDIKKQYLVIRKGNKLFNDITDEEFVTKILPKYPQISEFVATNNGTLPDLVLLKNLETFSNQDRRSIMANLRSKIPITSLSSDALSFDTKKLITTYNKWDIPSNERLYITKDGSAIVNLKIEEEIYVGLHTADDDYPNIKLNKRTAKYLLDYPELDKIPFENLIKLATNGVINKEIINKVIEKAKTEENSAIIIKKTEDGEILIDANAFTSYRIKNDEISKIPFDSEEVQQAFADAKDNEGFQQNALNLFKADENIPSTIDKDALVSVINAIPYNQRVIQVGDIPAVVLTADEGSPFFLMPSTINPRQQRTIVDYGGRGRDWRDRDISNIINADQWRSYFAYLRNTNQVYNNEGLKTLLGNSGYGTMNAESKKAFISNNPPIANDSQLKPAMNGNTALLINTADPRQSFKISDLSGKLVKANVPSALARQLLGQAAAAAPQAPAAQAGRRGRPAGVPNAPAAAAPAVAAPAAGGGNINVPEVMDETGLMTAFNSLPRADRNRLNVTTGLRVAPNGDRGAARRNNQLGGAGTVGRVIAVGPSKIYFIRLANQQVIASINIQPGNRNYILLPGGTMVTLNSPSELMSALQQRNLAEVHNYLVREYLHHNPRHLDEVHKMIKKHIAETKKY